MIESVGGSIGGIDLSTKEVFMVRRRAGGVEATLRRITLSSGMEFALRDAIIARELAPLVADPEFWEDVWLVGVEYPFTNPKAIRSVGLKTIMGAIIASIPAHVYVMPLEARYWTPHFLRTDPDAPLPRVPARSADRKPLIKARALELLDSDDRWPQDAYDAFGISWAAESLNAPALRSDG